MNSRSIRINNFTLLMERYKTHKSELSPSDDFYDDYCRRYDKLIFGFERVINELKEPTIQEQIAASHNFQGVTK